MPLLSADSRSGKITHRFVVPPDIFPFGNPGHRIRQIEAVEIPNGKTDGGDVSGTRGYVEALRAEKGRNRSAGRRETFGAGIKKLRIPAPSVGPSPARAISRDFSQRSGRKTQA